MLTAHIYMCMGWNHCRIHSHRPRTAYTFMSNWNYYVLLARLSCISLSLVCVYWCSCFLNLESALIDIFFRLWALSAIFKQIICKNNCYFFIRGFHKTSPNHNIAGLRNANENCNRKIGSIALFTGRLNNHIVTIELNWTVRGPSFLFFNGLAIGIYCAVHMRLKLDNDWK